ncbi:MAG: DUF4153 domain-containing protein [Bacteroidetes bacterium]|jgi:hypothetical protein|nr:DUF4153 domain-containing protein [Bacteroidota bacterium]
MKNNLSFYTEKVLLIIQKYPIILCVSLLAALSNIWDLEKSDEHFFLATKLVITFCLGIPLFFASKILQQRWKFSPIIEIVSAILLVGFYFILPNSQSEFSVVYAYKLIPIFLLAHLLVAISSLHSRQSENRFWQFNKNLFLSSFATLVFTVVLIGGVLLALLAVDKLFNINFRQNLYSEISSFLLIFGSTVLFLFFCNEGLLSLEKEEEYPKILKFFVQFILIPLLILYAIILYLYVGKIILQWQLPFGWVSYLVLVYSILGILALLLVHPLKINESKSWVKIFSKLFYFTLIPLIILLFVAISIRLQQYGFTEPRYFVLALGIWLVFLTGYFIISKKDKISFIPISLIIIIIFSLAFPYFNAFAVASRSQKKELQNLLIKENLMNGGKIDFNKPVTSTNANEISNKISFLMLRKENYWLKNYLLLKDYLAITKDGNYKWEYTYFGNTRNLFINVLEDKKNNAYSIKELISDGAITNISDYQYMAKSYNFNNQIQKIGNTNISLDDRSLDNNIDKRILVLKLSTGEQLDFVPLAKEKLKQYPNMTTNLPEVSLEGEIGNFHVKLLLDRLSISNNKFINWGDYQILIRQKK